MKQFHRCTQYCLRIFLLLASPLLSSFFPDMPHAAPTTPAQGFIMDMTPLLGSNGRIKAIAPGCRAVTGFLEGGPFVWSETLASSALPLPPNISAWGISSVMTGALCWALYPSMTPCILPRTARPGPAPDSSGATANEACSICQSMKSWTSSGTACRRTARSPWAMAKESRPLPHQARKTRPLKIWN